MPQSQKRPAQNTSYHGQFNIVHNIRRQQLSNPQYSRNEEKKYANMHREHLRNQNTKEGYTARMMIEGSIINNYRKNNPDTTLTSNQIARVLNAKRFKIEREKYSNDGKLKKNSTDGNIKPNSNEWIAYNGKMIHKGEKFKGLTGKIYVAPHNIYAPFFMGNKIMFRGGKNKTKRNLKIK